jgi:hypothetical protein
MFKIIASPFAIGLVLTTVTLVLSTEMWFESRIKDQQNKNSLNRGSIVVVIMMNFFITIIRGFFTWGLLAIFFLLLTDIALGIATYNGIVSVETVCRMDECGYLNYYFLWLKIILLFTLVEVYIDITKNMFLHDQPPFGFNGLIVDALFSIAFLWIVALVSSLIPAAFMSSLVPSLPDAIREEHLRELLSVPAFTRSFTVNCIISFILLLCCSVFAVRKLYYSGKQKCLSTPP